MTIVKKDKRRENFDREKLLKGIRTACQKRPLPTGAIDKMVDDIEAEIQRMGRSEISSSALGELVMEKLLLLDHIAYIRFASVYRAFTDIGSLKKEVDHPETTPEADPQQIAHQGGHHDCHSGRSFPPPSLPAFKIVRWSNR